MKKLLYVLLTFAVLVGILLLTLPTILHKAGLHPQYTGESVALPGKRAPIITDRRMTGVTDKQIKELGIEVTPLHPETELRKAGVNFESRTAFRDFLATHVTVDDEKRFVTGQNHNSGLETAHVMMQILAERK
ncbi:MAG: hypothetical protein R3E64_11205 [Halioglobus sp.]